MLNVFDRAFAPDTWSQWALVLLASVTSYFAIKGFYKVRDQANAAINQAKEAKRQADVAVDEFRLTHRPKLIVRNVVLPVGFTLKLEGGSFDVANVGDMPAHITNAHCEVLITEALPMRRPYEENHIGNIRADFLKVSSGSDVRLEIPDVVTLDGTQYTDIQNAIEIAEKLNTLPTEIRRSVYIVGYVRYVEIGHQNPRRTVFARIFDYRLRRFVPIEHGDYEYAD
jgi:hypothetical protein